MHLNIHRFARSLKFGVIGLVLLFGTTSSLTLARTHAPKNSVAKISSARARKVALKKYPGKVQGKIELENEDGRWRYSVLIRSGKKLREVNVDAKTGKIASVENTTMKEERAESREEAKSARRSKPTAEKR